MIDVEEYLENCAKINEVIDITGKGDDGDIIEKGGLKTFMESTPPSHLPNNPSLENIPEVSSLVSSSSHALNALVCYHLPFRHNRIGVSP